ncbi:uncharacterized protein LOC120391816 isoform X1 [Mauremys reevesii]|uniref:uncharacterized protein LOC120391816 isoform X1 n=1 Tax=Mauremys reevesii TaxID=260615 RepID=UPI00193F26D0|nr:uncharacterized protein LOC120391816 isoform X1 [Mauremys reevesii]
MAGKMFPEILIGDSEDTFKKPPTGKNIFRTRRDVRLISPLSADEESLQSNSLADSVERRELHEMGEEEEEEEGEPHQVVPGNITADGCSGLAVKEISGDGAHQELWTPFTSNTEEQLESRMSELGSISHSFKIEGKTTPPFSRPEHPENSSGDSESYCLLDEDSILSDSAVSTGYFPCYRTYGELPRYQPPRSASSQPGNAEGRAGSSCDASVQCSGCSEEDPKVSDTRASDTTQSSRDRGETLTCETVPSNPNAPSGGPLAEGNRHRPSGKEFEGKKDRDSSQQHLALETQRGFGPEVSENLKEPEDTLTKEAASELLVPGGTPSVSLGKDSGQLPGTEPQSSLLPSKGKVPTSLHSAATTKKSSPKEQQKQCRKEEEEVRRAKLAPLLGPGDAVPGRKRGSWFPCGHSPETGHCEIEASGSGQEGGHGKLSPRSCPTTSGNWTGEEPRSTPSRLSLRSLVSWVRKIFRRSSTVKPQAGSSWGTEEARGQVGSRLRWWISRRRNRIHPH